MSQHEQPSPGQQNHHQPNLLGAVNPSLMGAQMMTDNRNTLRGWVSRFKELSFMGGSDQKAAETLRHGGEQVIDPCIVAQFLEAAESGGIEHAFVMHCWCGPLSMASINKPSTKHDDQPICPHCETAMAPTLAIQLRNEQQTLCGSCNSTLLVKRHTTISYTTDIVVRP